ncbi:pentapeptide repeat-containing protein [Nocardia tengchongensis]|uniref:pentapeptide repeat-containing protein n=1 Tax=Nocardia tengchongensis TaxID=2055889 RepID=UPI0036AB80DB
MLAWVGKSYKAVDRFVGRVGLFPSILVALCGGLVVAVAADRFLRWITPIDTTKPAAQIDITRIALTVVAGVGGVVALVIAYRRQRDIEQGRFVERFGAAAAQLGATDVAVRIAGVYAMAGVADESTGLRRQQCIDVLCGYLRLPYSPELGSNHQSKLVLKHHRATADGTRADDSERHLEYRHDDREVRATIVRVIADHLRPTAEYSWSTSDFDFRTAHLEDIDLSAARFSGTARFADATFAGPTRFKGATFAGTAEFGGATFAGTAWFKGATFAGTAGFDDATFSGIAGFEGATFSGIAGFGGATFSGIAGFEGATFSTGAWFRRATFYNDAEFRSATFSSTAWFAAATFSSDAWFVDATFSGPTRFASTTFSGSARFEGATFSSTTGFGGAAFSGIAGFAGVTFSSTVMFEEVTFSSTARFDRVDFGAEVISFAEPRQWGPPAPQFDWDQDLSQKPGNVKPEDWPPTVTPPPVAE